MHILIAGASGFIGSALTRFLESERHVVRRLVRSRGGFALDPSLFEGIDAVINLSGESIFSGRWTEEKKRRILESRVKTSQLLVSAMRSLERRPRVFIQASAVGFYGDTRDEEKDERSKRGDSFLSQVCLDWEAAAQEASLFGVRTVVLRFGFVLGAQGGILGTILPFFKLGLGARLGSGRQWMSWIALSDLTSLFLFALMNEKISGPVNAVAPGCVTNAIFTDTLCKVLHRPQSFALPAWLLKLCFGKEKANELLLASSRVSSSFLKSSEFRFRFPSLEAALKDILLRR